MLTATQFFEFECFVGFDKFTLANVGTPCCLPLCVGYEPAVTDIKLYSASFPDSTPDGAACSRNSASLGFIEVTRSGSLSARFVVSPMSVARL